MQITRTLLLLFIVPYVCCIRLNQETAALPVDPVWEDVRKQMPHLLPDPKEDVAVRQIYNKYSSVLSFGNKGRQTLDGILKELAHAAEARGRRCLLMEIGVWLGASTAKWLESHPNIAVVGIDPFDSPKSDHWKVKRAHIPPSLAAHFGHEKFNRRLAEYVIEQGAKGNGGRFVLIPGFSPAAAVPVLTFQAANFTVDAPYRFFLTFPAAKVDAFYIDGGKIPDKRLFTKYINESLSVFYRHNPAAVFSGDDWGHPSTPTLQGTLKAFAAEKGLQLAVSQGRTWLMSRDLARFTVMKKSVTWVVKDASSYMGPTVSQIIESTRSH